MPPSDFHIDAQSILQAEKLTADLQKSHISTVEKDSREIIDSFRSEPKPGTAITQLSKPLDAIASEIPLRDIGIDVREFGVVAALAHTYDRPIFALPMGPENAAVPVPVLLARRLLRALLRFGDLNLSLDMAQAYFQDNEVTARFVRIPLKIAQEVFFHGLSTYLPARIAGVRWSRSQKNESPPGGGGGGGGGTSGGSGGGGSMGQWWTARTRRSGLSMYYAGTHAVREPPNYLSGLTTPLPIYLPMGTLYLGADAGLGGDIIWDESVVTVPSQTPTFVTKRF